MATLKSIPAVLEAAIAEARARRPDGAVLIGVSGAQGAGKSFHCRQLADASNGKVAAFSLDDFYFPKEERELLAAHRHKLFITRGPPGTHDLKLAREIIRDLSHASPNTQLALPKFDKLKDDRAPKEEWPVFTGRPDAILFEGWCLGAKLPVTQPDQPVNTLEAQEDPDGSWRAAIEFELGRDYKRFFANWFDDFVFLKAPSFDVVWQWREQQQRELLGRPLNTEEITALNRFIQHYERVSSAMIAGDHSARWIVHLDENRNVEKVERFD